MEWNEQDKYNPQSITHSSKEYEAENENKTVINHNA